MKTLQIKNENNSIIINCNYIIHIDGFKNTNKPHIDINFVSKYFEYMTITIDLQDIETLKDMMNDLIDFISNDSRQHKTILNYKK